MTVGRVFSDVCVSVCSFFHTMSQKTTQLGSPNLTETWFTMNPGKLIYFWVRGPGHARHKNIVSMGHGAFVSVSAGFY